MRAPGACFVLALALLASSPARAQDVPASPGSSPTPVSDSSPAPASDSSPAPVFDSESASVPVPPPDTAFDAVPDPVPDSSLWLLDRIVVRGNRRTATYVVERALPLRPGDTLAPDDERLEQARWQLLGTGFFDSVELSIERGRARGRVVLVVEVSERNTVLLEEIGLGVSEGLNGERQFGGDVYVGATLAETNLFGTGTSLDGSFVLSLLQQGLRLRFRDPHFFGSPLALTVSGFFLNAREVYGDEDVLVTPAPPPEPDPLFNPEAVHYALVRYHRGGASIGTGLSLDPENHLSVAYQLEVVDVLSRPDAASERRGTEIQPIDFALHDGTSFVATLTLALSHDERDDPGLTRRGRLVTVRGDLASRLLGGDYDFFRAQALWREWVALPEWDHSLRFTVFLGAALGDVPVFYRFYASDLSDLVPSRMLELNLDRRTAPNLLGTAITELRWGQLGARADVEYSFLVARFGEGVRAIFGFVDVGAYLLADTEHFVRPIPGYAISVPVDLTFDVGVRIDTAIGVFQLAFSTLLGFVSL